MDVVGRYRIGRQLGQGGMGVVFAAHDDTLGRSVAIKVMRDARSEPEARERMLREARAAAAVTHPNICQLYEIGEHDGGVFIAMELLEGEPLDARIQRSPLPVADARKVCADMLGALQALHDRGLIHRDLKPSNLFLTQYGAKLLDFGLARPVQVDDETIGLTKAGMIMGTPAYMSPEAFGDQPLDRRADVFAAGVILYEMLTGTPPFTGKTTAQLVRAILFEEPPAMDGSAGITALEPVVRRALSKKPNDRFESAAAMADAIRDGSTVTRPVAVPRVAAPLTRLIALPFRILRPDDESDFLAYSLPDAITTSLSGLGSLVVRSMMAAGNFSSASPDLRQIAAHADVDVVVTGSLLRAGTQLRVSSQLMEVPAGTVLWSETAQVDFDDVFRFQDELVRRVVESLSLPLTAREHRLLEHDVPANSKAYEAYLRANQLSSDTRGWQQAKVLYEECLSVDADYAPAWARLGRVRRLLGKYADDDAGQYGEAASALQRALAINPDLPMAHNIFAQLEIDRGQAVPAMVRLIERASTSAADPEIFIALVYACRINGLLPASLAADARARALEPKVKTSVAQTYFQLRQYDRVAEVGKESPYICGVAMAMLGRGEAADAYLSRVVEKVPAKMRPVVQAALALARNDREAGVDALLGFPSRGLKDAEAMFYVGRHLAWLGRNEDAVLALESAVQAGFLGYPTLISDPWLEGLHDSAAFVRIRDEIEAGHRGAVDAFQSAGGDAVLNAG